MSKKIIFDIGAHKGEDSQYYLARGYKVIAFECNPLNIEFLKKRFEKEIKSNEFILETKALLSGGGNNKKVKFYVNDISVWGTLNQDWDKRNSRLGSNSRSIEVETIDPKEIYNLYGIPYYMKIDIEGSDLDVLESVINLEFENRPKYISIESSKTSWSALLREFDTFKKLGYLKFQAIPQRQKIRNKITKWKNTDGEIISYRHENASSGPFGEDLKNNWKNFRAVKVQYKLIFLRYKLFGDDGIFAPRKINNYYLRFFYKVFLFLTFLNPNFFDTHAKKE